MPRRSDERLILAVIVALVVLPIALALWLPVHDVDWALYLATPCGVVASAAAASRAARRRRMRGEPVGASILVAYAALTVLATGMLVVIVFAIDFERTPLTF